MNSLKQRIVLTGAPSTGKSTTLARLPDSLEGNAVIVPESAVVLLAGGFPAPEHNDIEQIRAFQNAIIPVQNGIEMIFDKQNPQANLTIYDRGLIDGAGFWPLGPDDYLKGFAVDVTKEFAKYNYVLFFELPNEKFYGGINRLRFHDYAQSLECEKVLKQIWSKHPHFILISATDEFEDKIKNAISAIKACNGG
jgi:predicted ATPase